VINGFVKTGGDLNGCARKCALKLKV